jgi:hypothetical protein
MTGNQNSIKLQTTKLISRIIIILTPILLVLAQYFLYTPVVLNLDVGMTIFSFALAMSFGCYLFWSISEKNIVHPKFEFSYCFFLLIVFVSMIPLTMSSQITEYLPKLLQMNSTLEYFYLPILYVLLFVILHTLFTKTRDVILVIKTIFSSDIEQVEKQEDTTLNVDASSLPKKLHLLDNLKQEQDKKELEVSIKKI